MNYYLDTNIIIYAVKGSFPSIAEHFKKIRAMSVVVPSVVVAEIEYGARKTSNYQKTIDVYNQFLSAFKNNLAEFTHDAAVEYGKIRADLEKHGELIGPNDLIIAAIVKANDGILVTNNEKEFSRIPGLKIENWTK